MPPKCDWELVWWTVLFCASIHQLPPSSPVGRTLLSSPNDISLGHKTCADPQNRKEVMCVALKQKLHETRGAHQASFALSPETGHASAEVAPSPWTLR